MLHFKLYSSSVNGLDKKDSIFQYKKKLFFSISDQLGVMLFCCCCSFAFVFESFLCG